MSGKNNNSSGNSGRGATKNVSPEQHAEGRRLAKQRKQRGRASKGMHTESLLAGIQQDRQARREAAHRRRITPVHAFACQLLKEFVTHQFVKKDGEVGDRLSEQAQITALALLEFYFFGDEQLIEGLVHGKRLEHTVQRFYLLACEVLKADSRDTYAWQDWYSNDFRKEVLPYVGHNRDLLRKEQAATKQPEAIAS